MKPLAVLAVASEAHPLVKTGGLADVVGALPAALAAEGVAVRTLLPGYPPVLAALEGAATVLRRTLFGAETRLLAGRAGGLDLLALDAPHLFARPGNPYLGPDGADWPDNPQRFAALSMIAADVALGALAEWRPAVVHAHDWQGGLVPAYLHFRGAPRPATVMTVHNLAFPGKAAPALLHRLGLPPSSWSIEGVEFYGSMSFLKAGLQYADRITTVSPTYAFEIQTEAAGMGFAGLLRRRADVVSGILNGIDIAEWDPATDRSIAARYDRAHLAARAANRAALRREFGLGEAHGPLFGVVSRLTWQKGIDILLDCLPEIAALDGQLAVLGAGEPGLEARLRAAATAAPGRIGCMIGYDEALAHRIQAGADALPVPSRFEPCGLTQLCALRYGAVPVVSRVGGLADTVIDANPAALAAGVATGITFTPPDPPALATALRRAAALFAQPQVWTRMQANGMATDVSWRGPAREFAALFRSVAGR
jgi:starch synthase